MDKTFYGDYYKKYEEIHNSYKESLLTKDQIYDTFRSKLLSIIDERI